MSKERFAERQAEVRKANEGLQEAVAQPETPILRAALRRFPAVVEVTLFGSRAVGTARRASDLDLAISAPSATWADWADICEALNNAPLIYELDLVRVECTTNPRLLEKIDREGIVIYTQNRGEPQGKTLS